ncbi:hypothetical protein FZC79_18700 [Rossellomorea vietnamensis]|uniref:Uncharacterized protein n=1 Tax=Rossellomorea vietnamensis TaxID=218284 RepID=A0A5D4K8A5_9BACI|nr:PqqD family protein [Rossellomorea vietnamensis]TYR73472.1 hypothetical protein FZC79_18700 [Rossellomorea vietnamensis]
MILPSSIPSIPPGVKVENRCIKDASLSREHKIDKVGNLFLSKIDGKKSIHMISEELEKDFVNVDYEKIEGDYMQFLRILNRQHCINIDNSLSQKLLGTLVQLLQFRRVEPSNSRVEIHGTSLLSLTVKTLLLLQYKLIWMYLLALINTICLMLLLPGTTMIAGAFSFIAVFLFSLSLALHEATHLFTLRKLTSNDQLGHFEFRPLLFRLVRPVTEHEASIGVSGPLATAGVGVIMAWAGMFISDPFFYLFWLFLSSIFFIHLINLFPFCSDGKKLFSPFFKVKI